MKSSIELATRQAIEGGYHLALDDQQTVWFLEQCLYLVNGNPAAVELLMRLVCRSRSDIKQFFNALTDGSFINDITSDMLEGKLTRCFLDAQKIVRLYSPAKADRRVSAADVRLLAPFWRMIPCDIRPYQQIFQWAKDRASRDEKVSESDLYVRSRVERLSDDEFNILFGKKGQNFDTKMLQNLPSLSEILSVCEDAGFVVKDWSGPLEDHYTVHPMLTLILRQRQFAMDDWVQHVIEVAFQRYHIYRSRHWPTKGTMDPVWDQARAQLSFEFANFITACNYSLKLEVNRTNCYLLMLTTVIIHCLSDNPRRLSLVRDYLARFLEIFAEPLAQKPRSILLSTWHMGFHHLKNRLGLSLHDTWLDAKFVLEIICILTIGNAAILSESLGIPHDYLPLLEGIRSNISPYGEDTNFSLALIRGYKVLLEKFRNGSPVDCSAAVIEAFGPDIPVDRSQLHNDHSTVRTFVDLLGLGGRPIPSSMSVRQIHDAEKVILKRLEQQLDGANAPKIQSFEHLSVLAYHRQDFDLALEYIDHATKLANSREKVPAAALETYMEFRIIVCSLTQPGPDLFTNKCLHFEKLSVATFQRNDLDLALRHIDSAVELSHRVDRPGIEEGRRKLLAYRAKMCALKEAAGS